MKKARNALLALLCALLLIAGSVAGTLAYLTSKTEMVTNTFTAGNVTITLDEAKVDKYGDLLYKTAEDGVFATSGTELADRVITNAYTLLPGHTYVKDPTIHVAVNSEPCWLFVEITDELTAIQDATTIANQLTANGWTLVEGTTNIYWHAIVDAREAAQDVPVFANFKILGSVDNTTLGTYTGKTIKVTAYAVQFDGFATAKDAWTATFGAPQNG